MRFVASLVGLLLLAGCAAAPKVIDYYPEGASTQAPLSWPGPSDVPRLEYAGQLLGEQNFVATEAESGGARFLRWLTGLRRGGDRIVQLVRATNGGSWIRAAAYSSLTGAARRCSFSMRSMVRTRCGERRCQVSISFRRLGSPKSRPVVTSSWMPISAIFFVLSPDGVPLGRFTADTLLRPTGLDIDPDNGEVFVADKSASHVKVFSPGGVLLRTIGVAGDGEGQLNAPMHIRISGDKLFVSDALNANVQIFAKGDGRSLGQIGRRGLYVGNLVRPKGVTTDRDGNVYVIESYYDHLLIYNQDGELLLPIGGTGNDIGRFFLPAGAWSDDRDRIFVADMFNARVVIFRYVSAGA